MSTWIANKGTISEVTTNYDRLIRKTPEELADILIEHGFVLEWYCGKDEIKSVVYQPKDAKNKLIDWLKQEAEK